MNETGAANAIATLADRLNAWKGEVVVLDAGSPYVVIGRLESASADFVELTDADLHDFRDSETTREIYLVKTARLGVQDNRARVLVRLAEIVAVSRLADVQAG